MFRASSAHLQEDILVVVYKQHMVPSLSIRVLVACLYAARVSGYTTLSRLYLNITVLSKCLFPFNLYAFVYFQSTVHAFPSAFQVSHFKPTHFPNFPNFPYNSYSHKTKPTPSLSHCAPEVHFVSSTSCHAIHKSLYQIVCLSYTHTAGQLPPNRSTTVFCMGVKLGRSH